ncbi:MAG: iron-containing alcohol dehydrogenase [Pseudomonadota bacterium]
MTGYAGVIDALVAGTWVEPATGKSYGIPVEDIAIARTLAGQEAALVRARHGDKRITVVHDTFTRAALGERVLAALQAGGGEVSEFIWEAPRCTDDGVAELSAATEGAEVLVAVGSGTVSDSVKYATFKDGREYSVFPTSPMNAYTTPTASVAYGGFKKSITCHSAKGVFFDLDVLAKCPKRLIAAAFADVICRTTAQVDWLMSHLLFDTPYSEVAYTLLALDEDHMIEKASALQEGDSDALATLTRVAAVMGLSTSFTGTTHVGSMAEHMISHHIDMFAGRLNPGGHPGSSHGEQVGVATLTLSRLQNAVLRNPEPPTVSATAIPKARLEATYGPETAAMMVEATEAKALTTEGTARLNQHLADHWDTIRGRLLPVTRRYEEIEASMAAAGCQRTGEALGLSGAFYRQAVRDARFIRDRFTMLDLADDAGLLEGFLETVSAPSPSPAPSPTPAPAQ